MTDWTAFRLLAGRRFSGRGPRLRSTARGAAVSLASGPVTLIVAALILLFWWHNASHLVEQARPQVSLSQLEIRLARGESVTIGRRELLQPAAFDSAEGQHVSFTRQPDGKVLIRNVARERKLWLDYREGSAGFSARWRLQAGDRLAAGSTAITVEEAEPGRLRLSIAGPSGAPLRVLVERGGAASTVSLEGSDLRVCEPPKLPDRLKAYVSGLLASDERGEVRVLEIGGRLTCRVRDEVFIAAERLPFRSFQVVARGDGFFFAPGEPLDAPRPPAILARGNTRLADFSDIAWELDPPGAPVLSHMIIGRTRYSVEQGTEVGGRLPIVLKPQSKTHRLATEDAAALVAGSANDSVRPTPTPPRNPMSAAELGNSLSSLNGGEKIIRLAVALGLVGLSLLAALRNMATLRGGSWFRRVSGSLFGLGVVGGTAVLALVPEIGQLLRRPVSFEDTLKATVLAYALASLPILMSLRFTGAFRVIWLALLVLCCLGSLTLLSLAIDAGKTDFSIHAEKNKLLFIDLVPILAAFVAMQSLRSVEALPRSFFAGTRPRDHLLRAVPALLILASFVAWGMLGTETGVGGFQPVELGKVTLVFVLAHIFVGFSRIDVFYRQGQYVAWLALSLATVLVFFLFLTAIPFLKSDYSPILIMLSTSVVLAFAFLLPGTLDRIRAVLQVLLRRADAPQPKVRRLGWPRGGALAVTLALLLVAAGTLILVFPKLVTYAISGEWSLPRERAAAIEVLEKARGGAFRVPAERLLTWYDLDHHVLRGAQERDRSLPDVVHRDLGFQLLQSKAALAETPCVLTRLDLGLERLPPGWREAVETMRTKLPSLCDAAPQARQTAVPDRPTDENEEVRTYSVRDLMRVPVVQNDFIAAYLLVRFGLPTGLALIAAQIALVAGALMLSLSLLRARALGIADEAARRGMAIVVVGVAVMFALHWSISWGNALGVLPVMGQPMTFIAAATSHHLLMALPGIAVFLVAGRLAAAGRMTVTSQPPAWGLWRGLDRSAVPA